MSAPEASPAVAIPEYMKKLTKKVYTKSHISEISVPRIVYGTEDVTYNSCRNQNDEAMKIMDPEESNPLANTLVQKFAMEWVSTDFANRKSIMFFGFTGTLSGQQGQPGVVFDELTNALEIDLLLARTDGSFAITCPTTLCMVICPPNSEGNPDGDHLRYAEFTNGVKLPLGWFHSVPFPVPGKETRIELTEYVCETNVQRAVDVASVANEKIIVQLSH